jgi:hypothetical protein
MRFGFTTCTECGVTIPLAAEEEHECRHDQWIAHQVGRVSGEIERIDVELADYLETAHGKFDLWYAQRTRLRAA